MRKIIALLLVLIIGAQLFSACTKPARPDSRTKPLLSALSDEELERTLGELLVFIPGFHGDVYLGPNYDPVKSYLVSARRDVRMLEYNIDYNPYADGDYELYYIGELRRAVLLYYDGRSPGIRCFAVAGSPVFERTGIKLSELGEEDFISTLIEHFYGDDTGYEPDHETAREIVKKLEASPDADFREIYAPLTEHPVRMSQEELTVEELRRAVKLYYGYPPYDKPAESPDIFGADGEKTKLSEMEAETLRAVLRELGVLELFFDEKYAEDLELQLARDEDDRGKSPLFGYLPENEFLNQQVWRAVQIYYSEAYPFKNR